MDLMRISEIKLRSIAIADPPLRSSYGLHAPWALRTIVELGTDDGISGVSETFGGEAPRFALEAVRDQVLGMNPFRLAELWEGLSAGVKAEGSDVAIPGGRSQTWLVPGENPLDQNARTFAAIEIACLDIIGKAVGRPVCDLAAECATLFRSRHISSISTPAAEAATIRTSTARS